MRVYQACLLRPLPKPGLFPQADLVPSTHEVPSFEEARSLLDLLLPQRDAEQLPIARAYGRVLASGLAARVSHPSATESALDGVACRAADTLTASPDQPVVLRLVGASWAGEGFSGVVGVGQAARVATGGSMPAGSDAVCPVELLREVAGGVELLRPASPRDVRPRGSDFQEGDQVLWAGQPLTPQRMALAAALGHATVPVCPALRVGLLSTGSELRAAGEPLLPGEVYNSNAVGLTGLLQADGHQVVALGQVPDTLDAVRWALIQASEVDLYLTSGGASVGLRDVIRTLLTDHGELSFPGVRMRPGKAMLAGRYRDVPLIGLPGNPVAALVAYEVLVRPVLSGRRPTVWSLRAGSAFRSVPRQTAFWRAVVRDGQVHDQKEQGAGALRSLGESDVLVRVPEGQTAEVGMLVDVLPIG